MGKFKELVTYSLTADLLLALGQLVI